MSEELDIDKYIDDDYFDFPDPEPIFCIFCGTEMETDCAGDMPGDLFYYCPSIYCGASMWSDYWTDGSGHEYTKEEIRETQTFGMMLLPFNGDKYIERNR